MSPQVYDSDDFLVHRDGGNWRVKGSCMPAGSDANRPNSPSIGYSRYNTQRQRIEVWTGSEWLTLVNTRDIKSIAINPFNVRVNGQITNDLPASLPGIALTYIDIPAGYSDFYIVSSMQILCAGNSGEAVYQPFIRLCWSYNRAPSADAIIGYQSVVFPPRSNGQGMATVVTAFGSVENIDDTRPTSVSVYGSKILGGGPMEVYDIFLSVLAWNIGN